LNVRKQKNRHESVVVSTCTVNSATGTSPSKSQYQAYPGLFWSIEEVYRFHSFTGNMAQLWETKDRIG